jgi:hypothetical protein
LSISWVARISRRQLVELMEELFGCLMYDRAGSSVHRRCANVAGALSASTTSTSGDAGE